MAVKVTNARTLLTPGMANLIPWASVANNGQLRRRSVLLQNYTAKLVWPVTKKCVIARVDPQMLFGNDCQGSG
jgi:hypothetical protein